MLRKCLNWRVVGALGVVGLGIWALAPGALATVLPFLVVLVCPLSMILMMVVMGREMRSGDAAQTGSGDIDALVAERDHIEAQISAISAEAQRMPGDRARG